VQRTKPQFVGGEQQDAHEFLIALLELVELEMLAHFPAAGAPAADAGAAGPRMIHSAWRTALGKCADHYDTVKFST
jgi:hypothetical protein